MRAEATLTQIQQLSRQVPFRPFALNMENGDRVVIEHPENIAFQPSTKTSPGSREFHVLSNQLHIFSSFDPTTSVAVLDRGRSAAGQTNGNGSKS